MMDEEVFEYLQEASRVLKAGSVAIFSFMDFDLPSHQDTFFEYARQHRHGHEDILKFTTKDVLTLFGTRVGFGAVSFIDGCAEIRRSPARSALLDVAALPATFQFGQSLCILHK